MDLISGVMQTGKSELLDYIKFMNIRMKNGKKAFSCKVEQKSELKFVNV